MVTINILLVQEIKSKAIFNMISL